MSSPYLQDPEVERLRGATQWLVRLREAGEDEALIAEWLAWLDADPQNADAFERVKDTWQVAGVAAALLPRPDIASRGRGWRRFSSRHTLRVAAAVLLAVAGTLLLRPQEAPSEQTLSTPVAIHGSSLLPDGSRVELGARSRISTQFEDGVRRVVIEAGEAYFEVAHDKTRPFIVQAGALTVTAVGTAFNVRRGDEKVVVTVTEGRVRLEDQVKPQRWPTASAVTQPALEAGAGEQAVYSARERSIELAAANPEVATAWRVGVLKFVHEPLDEVVANLNRYSAREIELADPALARLRYSGTVFGNRLEDWLEAVESIFPLHVVYEGTDRIVLVPGKSRGAEADARKGSG